MTTRVYIGGITHRCRDDDLEYFFRKYGKIKDISIKNKYAFVDFDDVKDAEDAVYYLHKKEFMGEIVSVEIARGTPHGRDKERWGYPSSGRRSRSRSRSRRSRSRSRSRSRRRSRSRSRSRRSRSRSRSRDRRKPIWLDKYGPPTRTDYRVIVENLSTRVSWQDLKDFMRSAGDVTFADAHRQRRNEGVVEFACYEDVENVIRKLDGAELNGRTIRIRDDTSSSKRRSRSRRRSRSDSRRSRSRSRRSRSRSRRSRSRKSRSRSGGRKSRSRSRKSRSRSGGGRKSRSRSGKSRSASRNGKRSESPKRDRS